jgi:1,4-alpha-glucan branching enzyme
VFGLPTAGTPEKRARKERIKMLKKRYVKSRKVCKVTFELSRHDLPGATPPESLHLVGEFNDWDTTATPMPRRKSVYRVMVELEPGKAYQFRYLVNGRDWFNDPLADDYVMGGQGAENGVVIALTE